MLHMGGAICKFVCIWLCKIFPSHIIFALKITQPDGAEAKGSKDEDSEANLKEKA